MNATLPPSAPPSIANPLTIGQPLWRIIHPRGGPALEAGSVSDLKGHYAEITIITANRNIIRTEWIDARDPFSPWHRHQPSAAIRVASLYPFGSVPWLAALLMKIHQNFDPLKKAALRTLRGMSAGKWVLHVQAINQLSAGQPHPKTVARAMRWLAAHGLAIRHGGRKARWEILNLNS